MREGRALSSSVMSHYALHQSSIINHQYSSPSPILIDRHRASSLPTHEEDQDHARDKPADVSEPRHAADILGVAHSERSHSAEELQDEPQPEDEHGGNLSDGDEHE